MMITNEYSLSVKAYGREFVVVYVATCLDAAIFQAKCLYGKTAEVTHNV